MRKRIVALLALLLVNFCIAQVGINTSVPHASAELDVTSTTRGLLLPRLTTTAINDLTPTASEGLLVFNTTTKQFLGFNGTSWQAFTTTTASLGTPQTATFAYWETGGIGTGDSYGASPFAGTVSQISSASLTRGVGVGTSSGTPGAGSWGGTDFNTSATTATAAITSNEFFTFTLNLPSSTMFSFTKISAYNIRRSGSGPTTFQWQYSINGGAFTDIGSGVSVGGVTTAAGNPMPELTLSSITALQNLPTTTTSVAFRIVPYGATNAGGTFYINNNSIVGNDIEIIGTYQ